MAREIPPEAREAIVNEAGRVSGWFVCVTSSPLSVVQALSPAAGIWCRTYKFLAGQALWVSMSVRCKHLTETYNPSVVHDQESPACPKSRPAAHKGVAK
jgi:hypothetical protein